MDITIRLDEAVYDTLCRMAREDSLSVDELTSRLLKELAQREERISSAIGKWKSRSERL